MRGDPASVPAPPSRGPGWWGIGELGGLRKQRRLRRVLVLWCALAALAVAAGVANVQLGWNGLELRLFDLPFDVTLYPPFVISICLALWVGPVWGAVPIYLANFASAVVAGMDPVLSALFALAGTIETLILWGSLVALRVDPDLRRGRDVAWFLAAGLVAAVTGSLAAILWNSVQDLDLETGQRIWRGWVLGDVLQLVLVVLPALRLLGARARGWIDRQFVSPPRHDVSFTHGVAVAVAAFSLLGLVVYLGVFQAAGTLESLVESSPAVAALLPRLREIILVLVLLSAALIVATGIFSTALARLGERERREALRDSLTGCFNRRGFERSFALEAERSRRLGMGIGVLFLDLDRFKELNDVHGHEVGDLVLERLARRVEESIRETDLLFRWGGEEFLVLMPHTAAGEVARVAERVRAAVAEAPLLRLVSGVPLAVTVSLGAAAEARLPCDPETLLRAADAACYQAKRQGRNRAVVAS